MGTGGHHQGYRIAVARDPFRGVLWAAVAVSLGVTELTRRLPPPVASAVSSAARALAGLAVDRRDRRPAVVPHRAGQPW